MNHGAPRGLTGPRKGGGAIHPRQRPLAPIMMAITNHRDIRHNIYIIDFHDQKHVLVVQNCKMLQIIKTDMLGVLHKVIVTSSYGTA